MKQQVRFLNTPDDISLAWTRSGRGQPLVKASNWLTHLEFDQESPVWCHWTRFFEQHFNYIRYDERGCGMSDREAGDLSFPRWVDDLAGVIDAACIDEPFVLLGISQGAATAIAYAARYPARVSKLILYGGYARGANRRNDVEFKRLYEAMEELVSIGWEKDSPVFRRLFTSRFIPEGTEQQIGWFNELCRKTTTAANGAKLLAVRADVDTSDLLDKVRVPTLVLHADRDEVVPLYEGRFIARSIAGARFVQLQSRNHILLEHELAWHQFRDAVLEFTGVSARGVPESAEQSLSMSDREREVFALVCEGRSNAQVASRLGLSEKTVRNHLSNLYQKLGVRSRAEAIVWAHRQRLFG